MVKLSDLWFIVKEEESLYGYIFNFPDIAYQDKTLAEQDCPKDGYVIAFNTLFDRIVADIKYDN